MQNLEYYVVMADYNQWMNQRLYALCAEIPDETRKTDAGAFFKSIHGTLNHLLYGDRAWMRRFTQRSFDLPKIGQDLYDNFDELRHARNEMDGELCAWSRSLSSEWLGELFTFTSAVDGKTRTRPAWLLVTHMFNHQTHHRGQLTTLLSQLGYDPGVTDLPLLPSLDR
jgi:uncharacterized damage-inducible protein DinB